MSDHIKHPQTYWLSFKIDVRFCSTSNICSLEASWTCQTVLYSDTKKRWGKKRGNNKAYKFICSFHKYNITLFSMTQRYSQWSEDAFFCYHKHLGIFSLIWQNLGQTCLIRNWITFNMSGYKIWSGYKTCSWRSCYELGIRPTTRLMIGLTTQKSSFMGSLMALKGSLKVTSLLFHSCFPTIKWNFIIN